MVGTLGEGFLPDAFFAGTLDKVSDFEIVFEFKIFFGHCWHPHLPIYSFIFNHEIHKPHEIFVELILYFFVSFVLFVVKLFF